MIKIDDYYLEGSNEIVIELEGEDDDGNAKEVRLELTHGGNDLLEDSIRVHKIATGYRVDYLSYDDDASSSCPEDADGSGKIGTALSRDGRELHERFQEALGLNSDWSRRVKGDDIVQEIADDVFADRTDKNWRDLLRDPEPDWDHDAVRDDLKITYRRKWDLAVAEHEANGDFGDPDRVMLSVYEHGGRIYQVGSGAGMPDRQWDVSEYSAVWVPDDVLRNDEAKGLTGKERQAKMEEWAGQLVESMNDWMNGAVYGVIHETYDEEGNQIDEDSYWGVIGSKYAEEELEMAVKYATEHPELENA